ncbi:hypothetical protein LT85_3902 [Collimonas arenae]|uniref:Uncharacterized protein n=1 Tax=Collimonas arenae TaxID=279058 RepID=A0A0A1FHA1_9BURK|nr:hypothetical protein LT85_3902 [Collimonas arenae]
MKYARCQIKRKTEKMPAFHRNYRQWLKSLLLLGLAALKD